MSKPFDPTKPVRTRDGRPARIICTDRRGPFPIVALLKSYGGEEVRSYDQNGQFADRGPGVANDLLNIPEKIEGYVNVYRASTGGLIGTLYSARAWADAATQPDRIACLKISGEEGQFDG